jgi:hypothetical protein
MLGKIVITVERSTGEFGNIKINYYAMPAMSRLQYIKKMINIKTFYLIAGVLMAVSTIASTYSLVVSWSFLNLGAKVSSIAGNILFQLLLSVFFLGMYRITPQIVVENPALDDFVKELQEEVKNK